MEGAPNFYHPPMPEAEGIILPPDLPKKPKNEQELTPPPLPKKSETPPSAPRRVVRTKPLPQPDISDIGQLTHVPGLGLEARRVREQILKEAKKLSEEEQQKSNLTPPPLPKSES